MACTPRTWQPRAEDDRTNDGDNRTEGEACLLEGDRRLLQRPERRLSLVIRTAALVLLAVACLPLLRTWGWPGSAQPAYGQSSREGTDVTILADSSSPVRGVSRTLDRDLAVVLRTHGEAASSEAVAANETAGTSDPNASDDDAQQNASQTNVTDTLSENSTDHVENNETGNPEAVNNTEPNSTDHERDDVETPWSFRVPRIMQGISYGPSPMTSQGTLPNDDFMCNAAEPQWGASGRNDLGLIKAMGANAVRLYGNDFETDHTGFLDAALLLRLSVLPGISDFPYLQASYSCKMAHGYNCFENIKSAYLGNLRKGFLQKNGTYHPTLKYVIAINEPDMKLPDISQPKLVSKAIISALDGMLAAEEEAGVVGPRPNFTVTFSFTVCGDACPQFGQKPALGQMMMLRDAIFNPWNFDYKPQQDLGKLYSTRFTNSFNTGNPSWEIPGLFLNDYTSQFPTTPVFIAEYHCPNQDTRADVESILKIAHSSALLLGISFFEFVVRHDVGGHEKFGIFLPVKQKKVVQASPMSNMQYFGGHYAVPCLVPKDNQPALLTTAFNGDYSEVDRLLHKPDVCV